MLSISKLSHLASLTDIDLQHDAQLLGMRMPRHNTTSLTLIGSYAKGPQFGHISEGPVGRL